MCKTFFLTVSVILICVSALSAETQFFWGAFQFKLVETGTDNYTAFADIRLSEARNLGKIEFQLFENDKQLGSFSERHLFLRKGEDNFNRDLALEKLHDRLTDTEFINIASNLAARDKLICYLKTSNNKMYSLILTIKADAPAYRPPVVVPSFSKITHFKYQLVTKGDGNQVLKLDTTLAENKSILNAYRNISKVKISHIPKYQTSTNFIEELDSVIFLGKRNLFIHPVNKPKYEYLAAAIEPIELTETINPSINWNKMIAQPDSPVFSMEYLKGILEHKISYFDGPKKYDIVCMRFTYFDGKKLNKSYYWDETSEYPFEEIKDRIEPFSMIIDKIIIKDTKQHIVYIPQSFLFNFE